MSLVKSVSSFKGLNMMYHNNSEIERSQLDDQIENTKKGSGNLILLQTKSRSEKKNLIDYLRNEYDPDYIVIHIDCKKFSLNPPYAIMRQIMDDINADISSRSLQDKKSNLKRLRKVFKETVLEWISAIPVFGEILAAAIKTIKSFLQHFGDKIKKQGEITFEQAIKNYIDELRQLAQKEPILIFLDNINKADHDSLKILSILREVLEVDPFPLFFIGFFMTEKSLSEDNAILIKLFPSEVYIYNGDNNVSLSQNRLPGHIVPLPVSDPVGRENIIQVVYQKLKLRNSIVITGIAGIGKSTVMASAVRRIADSKNPPYTDIYFHRLAEQGSKEERLNALLLSLMSSLNPQVQVESENSAERIKQTLRLLNGKTVLFAIDNADDKKSQHVVEELRVKLPNITLVVTSRHLYSTWKGIEIIDLEGISRNDGLVLFKRAYKNKITKGEINKIESICDQVNGHPMMITHLALESHQSGLSLKEWLKNFKSIEDIPIGLADRFKSIAEHLPTKCKSVLDLIGHMSTASIRTDLVTQATKATIQDLREMEVRYLISFHPDRKRFSVHELIRKWCENQLINIENDPVKQSTIDNLREEIAKFYIDYLHSRQELNPEILSEIDNEWPNIIGLIDNVKNPELVLVLIDKAMGDHYEDPKGYISRRCQTASMISRSKKIINWAANTGGLLSARIEKNLGHYFYWKGDHSDAKFLFLRAKERYTENNNLAGEASTTWLLGYLADDENNYREAEYFYRLGTEIAEKVRPKNPELVAIGHHLIGCTLYHQGKFYDAETEFNRARELVTEEAEPHLVARIDRRLGRVAFELGQIDDAELRFNNVLKLVKIINRPRDEARILRQLAVINIHKGDLDKAESILKQALQGFKDFNALRGIGYTYREFAILKMKQGDLVQSKEYCDKSLKIATEKESLYGVAAAYETYAEILNAEDGDEKEIYHQIHHACNIYTVINHTKAKILKGKLNMMKYLKPQIPKNIKGVLFDLMDTLAYLEKDIYNKKKKELGELLGVSQEKLYWAWSNSRQRASNGLFEDTKARMQWVADDLKVNATDQILKKMTEIEESMWRDHVILYPHAIPLLEMLKESEFSLAIISNGPKAMECLINSLNISQYFKEFIISCQVGITKPDERIYTRTLSKLNLDAAECIFVGDGNDHELDGAHDLGIFAVKINRQASPYTSIKTQSLDWDMEIEELGELQKLIEKNIINCK